MLRRWFSPSEWAVRILGLPRSKLSASERGLIILQIDGLARRHLENAFAKDRMRFLKKLQLESGYQLHSFYSGMPSSTPAVQGELFYGVRSAVPAFHFVDHTTGEFTAMFDPASAAKREASIESRSDRHLLEGGSSYSNVYTGGAEESHFCASSIGWSNFVKQSANPLKLAFIALSNFPSFIRVGVLMLVELILAVRDALCGIIAGRDLAKEITLIPGRVAFCVLLRELITIFVRMDITRGVPLIHANLLAYDEQAHRRGPDSRYASWALGGIDSAIRRIARAAQRATRRSYDVWIYSDHGQEQSQPYQRLTGSNISQSVRKAVQSTGLIEALPLEARDELESDRITGPRANISYRRSKKPLVLKAPDEGFRVVARGPIGNIYFRDELTAGEKERLARTLVDEYQIPFILYVDASDRVIVMDREGRCDFLEESAVVLGADHPFLEAVTEDLAQLCFHDDGGQLLICGYHAGQPSISFAMENGSHAGPGQDETHAFALLPKNVPLNGAAKDGHLRPLDLRHAVRRYLEIKPSPGD